jgi:putative redox protein
MATPTVRLDWTGEALRFRGGAPGGPQVSVDSDGKEGPSPMQSLLLAVAGCMGVDVVMILEKGRVPLDSLSVEVEGDRAEDPPRRFTAIRMTYRIAGPRPEDRNKVQRAVDLSRDRYCSVLHTLRPDLALDIQVDIA